MGKRDAKGRFVPGQSGNPSGRPPANHRVVDAAREHTELAIRTLAEICGDPEARKSARVAAANALLDRAYGRPPQAMEHSVTGETPAALTITWREPGDEEESGDGD